MPVVSCSDGITRRLRIAEESSREDVHIDGPAGILRWVGWDGKRGWGVGARREAGGGGEGLC